MIECKHLIPEGQCHVCLHGARAFANHPEDHPSNRSSARGYGGVRVETAYSGEEYDWNDLTYLATEWNNSYPMKLIDFAWIHGDDTGRGTFGRSAKAITSCISNANGAMAKWDIPVRKTGWRFEDL